MAEAAPTSSVSGGVRGERACEWEKVTRGRRACVTRWHTRPRACAITCNPRLVGTEGGGIYDPRSAHSRSEGVARAAGQLGVIIREIN